MLSKLILLVPNIYRSINCYEWRSSSFYTCNSSYVWKSSLNSLYYQKLSNLDGPRLGLQVPTSQPEVDQKINHFTTFLTLRICYLVCHIPYVAHAREVWLFNLLLKVKQMYSAHYTIIGMIVNAAFKMQI